MKASTLNAIKTLLRLDASVTPDVRQAVIAAAQAHPDAAVELNPDHELALVTAADYLGISRTTLWRMCSRGEIAAARRGKKFYIPGAVVAAFKESHAA